MKRLLRIASKPLVMILLALRFVAEGLRWRAADRQYAHEIATGLRYRAYLPACTKCGGMHLHEVWPLVGTLPWVGAAHDSWPQ